MVSGERLSLNGDKKDLGLAVQEAFKNIKDLDEFLEKTVALINNFPWTSSTTGFEIVENGIDGYVSTESKASFEGNYIISYFFLKSNTINISQHIMQ